MPSKRPPSMKVSANQPRNPPLLPWMARWTPYCMVNDDSTSRMVATRTGGTSSRSPWGGQTGVSARRLK